MKKYAVDLLLTMVVLMLQVPSVQATETTNNRMCGENVTWTLDDSGNLYINGTGPMYDDIGSHPWWNVRDNIVNVIVESGVTSIGDNAFDQCIRLTSITIPNSVSRIGDASFAGCLSLANIAIPDSVTQIGNSAFVECSKLEDIIIPNSVANIDAGAFYECTSISEVAIPSSVTSICASTFSKCTNLTSVTIPNTVTSIGEWAFYNCESLKDVYYSGTKKQWDAIKTEQGNNPLRNADIHFNTGERSGTCGYNLIWSLDASGTLTISGTGPMDDYSSSIEKHPLWNQFDDSINTVIISSGVTSIGDWAFDSCRSLTSIEIPSGVTSIGERAFWECDSLTTITLPNSITSIGDEAFENCSNLTHIKIPNSVTSVGKSVFSNCYSLKDCTIPSGITSIGDSMFDSCRSLESITIPNSINRIGSGAFSECSDLESIVIPNSVSSIGRYAFSGCNSLTNITIPSGVTSIEDLTFSRCRSLTNIAIPNSVTSIGSSAFSSCPNLTSITIPRGVSVIGESAFSGCINLTDITLPEKITTVEMRTFSGCTNLTSIRIPDGVTMIKAYAFGSCKSLINIMVPNSVIYFGDYLFSGCNSLKDIIIPASVIHIGLNTFSRCENLTNVHYIGSQTQWKAIQIFDGNDSLENATIHYNSSGSNQHERRTGGNNIDQYSYSFANDAKSFGYPNGYRIPLERFQLIFGKTALAKQKYGQAFTEGQYWSGSCYGMSTTAGMFATDGNNVSVTAFRNGATCPRDLLVSDINTEWGLTLTQFIETMQISQYSSMCAMAQQQNRNRLSALTSAVSTYDNGGGGPVVICVYGADRNGLFSGHALLAYHLDGQKIYPRLFMEAAGRQQKAA